MGSSYHPVLTRTRPRHLSGTPIPISSERSSQRTLHLQRTLFPANALTAI